MGKVFKLGFGFLFFLAFVLLAGVEGAKAADPAAEKKSTYLKFSGVTVAGEGKKPQVYYLLNRKRIQLEHRPIEKDFLKEVGRSLKQEPFKD